MTKRANCGTALCLLLLGAALWPPLAEAQVVKLGGNGASLPVMVLLAGPFSQANRQVTIEIVPSLGSTGGIDALIHGALGVAASSRPLKEAERRQGLVEAEYGRAPFAFVTSAKTGIDAITMQDAVAMYAGSAEKWPNGQRVRLVLRPLGDSDSELIKSMSPAMRDAKRKAETRPGLVFAVNDQENADLLEKLAGTFGAATVPQLMLEKRAVTILKLDGRKASAQAIADGSYPYYKRMYIVLGPKSPPAAHAFVAFVRSAAGRKLLTDSGHWVPE